MKRVDPGKVLILSVGIVVGISAVVALLLLLMPTLLTGRFCEITIESLEFTPHGEVILRIRQRMSVDIVLELQSETKYWKTTNPWGFPAWPLDERETIVFWLISDRERLGYQDSPELHRRVPIESGRTFRLEPGERLVYFRGPDSRDRPVERSFDVGR